jgi:hypothetical protein
MNLPNSYQRELRALAKSKLGLKNNVSETRLLQELNKLDTTFTKENMYELLDTFKKANDKALGVPPKKTAQEKRRETIRNKKQQEHQTMLEELRRENEAEQARIEAIRSRRRRTREFNVIIVADCNQVWKEDDSGRVYKKTLNFQETFETVEEEIEGVVEEYLDEKFPVETTYTFIYLINFTFQVVKEFPSVDIQDVPLRKALPVKMSYLKYFNNIDNCSYDDYEGECVLRMLMNHLDIKKRKTMIEAFEEAHKEHYPTLKKCSARPGDKWEIVDGITPRMILHFCKSKNISCLGFDQRDNMFMKYCRDEKRTRKYNAIIFYACVGHFYIITDKKAVAHISNCFAEKTYVKSSFTIENKEALDKEYISLEEFAEESGISFDDEDRVSFEELFPAIEKVQDETVIIFDKTSLNEEFQQYVMLYNEVPKVSFESLTIIKSITIGKCVLALADNSISTSLMKTACEKAEIKFTNQSIGTFLTSVADKFFKPERIKISTETKDRILNNQNNLCLRCKECFNDDVEVDHIRPLSNGGSNNFDNLQALCRSCHIEKTREEKNTCSHFRSNDYQSMFNLQAYKEIVSKFFHRVQFSNFLPAYYNMDELSSELSTFSVDSVKCRRNILLHSGFKFPVYSCLDNIKDFDGKLEEGFYYVETENVFPLRKNGFYSFPLVKFCLEEKIISRDEIIYQFKPSMKLKSDYFHPFIQHLDKTFDKETVKLAVNSMIGMFGRKNNSFIDYLVFEKDNLDDMAYAYTKFKNPYMFDINESFSFTTSKLNFDKLENSYPIYAQILDIEALELYKLTKIVESQGGVPVCIKTDAVVYLAETEIDTSSYFWDRKKTIPHYRHEEASLLKRETNYSNSSRFELPEMNYHTIWDTRQKNFNIDIAQKIIESEKGCFLDGMAGCGKTALVNELVRLIGDEQKIKRLTPTNVSALLIEGETVDKFSHTLLSSSKAMNSCRVKYIFIDEISMMREWFYGLFLTLKHKNPHIKFIISGDFGQLPPVGDRAYFDYRNSRALYELVDGNKVHLTLCRRSDDKLYNLCRDVRQNKQVDINEYVNRDWSSFKNICFTNQKRKEINSLKIKEFIEKQERSSSGGLQPSETFQVEALPYDKNTQAYTVCQGMPLISRVNRKDLQVLNNEMFECLEIEKETIKVLNEKKEIEISKKDFYKIFLPAFCITTHKSQGLSIDENYTIHEYNKFNNTLKYVALSRATDAKFIKIIR